MIINADILRRDTLALLRQIETQIEEVKKEAQSMGIPPETLRDSSGGWAMSPLLLARAMTYSTLVQLQIPKPPKK